MKTLAITLSYLPIYVASMMIISVLALAPLYSYAQINIDTQASSSIELMNEDEATSTDDNILKIEIGTDTEATSSDSTENSTSLRVNMDGLAITVAGEVRSDEDLEIFTHNVSESEEKVSSAKVESEENGAWEAEVSYEHEGKLFGLMQVTLKSKNTVEIDEEGTLEVHSDLPWWNFMVTKKNHAENEIESRLRDNATIMAAAEVEANAAVKAQVVEAMIAELNAHTYIHSAINVE